MFSNDSGLSITPSSSESLKLNLISDVLSYPSSNFIVSLTSKGTSFLSWVIKSFAVLIPNTVIWSLTTAPT